MPQPPLPDDPDTLRGPGGLTLREVHALVRQSVERDQAAQPASIGRRKGVIARLRLWWRSLRDRAVARDGRNN